MVELVKMARFGAVKTLEKSLASIETGSHDKNSNGEMDITGKIRYNSDGAAEIIKQVSDDHVEMHFPAGGREAITPWQNLPGETNILRHRLQWVTHNEILFMKTSITSFLLLIAVLIAAPVSAQFEGQVQYRILNVDSGVTEQTDLNMVFTSERIFIGSSSSLNVMSGLSTNGILVRNDEQDFVFNTGENEAFKIAKYDIDRLVELMNRVSGKAENDQKQGFDWDNRVEETGRTQQLHGYTVKEFVLKEDSKDRHVSVWLTDEIKVRWGLLNDAWHTTGKKQLDQDLPVELIMNPNSFPLLIEGFNGDQRVFKAEALSVNNRDFNRSLTELSPNVNLLGLSDLMMSMFRQRR